MYMFNSIEGKFKKVFEDGCEEDTPLPLNICNSIEFKQDLVYNPTTPFDFIYVKPTPNKQGIYCPKIDLYINDISCKIIKNSMYIKMAAEDALDESPFKFVDKVFKKTRPLTDRMLTERECFLVHFKEDYLSLMEPKKVRSFPLSEQSLYMTARYARLQVVKFHQFYMEKFASLVEEVLEVKIPEDVRETAVYKDLFTPHNSFLYFERTSACSSAPDLEPVKRLTVYKKPVAV
jgi:hypothetical protein